MRLRRARCLACYWHAGSFVAHAYPHGAPTALHPAAAEILSAFEEWTEPAEAAQTLGTLTPRTVGNAVRALRGSGLLLEEGSTEAAHDDALARQWGPWAPEASFYHYATQDVLYPGDDPAAGQTPPTQELPPLFTSYPQAERLLLPRPPAGLRTPYGEVLHRRRTCRDFRPEPVALATLATLLATVFGPADFIDCGNGALYRRTSPAGGARQEIDAYVGVLNVEGAAPGTYHYNVLEHSLELRSEGLTPGEAAHLCADQGWAGAAAFLVVLVAALPRMGVKYATPRSYRVCLLDAGHLGQTFALTATALGLGPAQTGAFHDSPVAARCGVDNTAHTPLYVLAAGHPDPAQPQAPPSARAETFRATPLSG
ncbi:SagB/ThcOx family dehydrogenase [Streptomyces sp. TRM 70351]|uniref:SagB/ThcOx family dehydrogenase n=1 Tax=Streptomyces sp. TRM 70351 TaxID=3116552 RepID=UPI002E7BD007|nr:SagB/ThcOx family dehydrogenase [Streptomyces sp. TRM 70351]MEE1927132.1 SagB/ThcOx family dehydrogenase [Streptomyces sp. TRM 70351]